VGYETFTHCRLLWRYGEKVGHELRKDYFQMFELTEKCVNKTASSLHNYLIDYTGRY